jgi:hypothetical protein
MAFGFEANNILLFFIAVLNAYAAFMAWRTHSLTQTIEISTNSMKDALVKATAEASHASGLSEGLARAATDKALFEAGVKSQRDEKLPG